MENSADRSPSPSYPVSAAGNALRVVRLLHELDELRVMDVADRLGVARSTAHRDPRDARLRGIRRAGPPQGVPAGAGSAGDQGKPAAPPPDLITIAHPHLRRLADAVRETTHLMVLEGNGSRFLDGVEGPQALRVSYRTGTLLPAHVTSGGKALLAALPADRLRALYPNGLPEDRAKAPKDFESLMNELVSVRRHGYALNLQESERGVHAVGACVRDRTAAAVAAVVVAAPSVRCTRARLAELSQPLLTTARDIGQGL